MADFEAGSAFVALLPSARGFSKKAEAELAKAGDLDKSVDLDADASRLQAAIAEVKAQLKALDREKANPKLNFDASVAQARIAEVTSRIEELGRQTATPKVDVALAQARRELDVLQRQLAGIDARRAAPTVDADTARATAQLDQLERLLGEVDRRRAEPRVDADTTVARQRLQELQARLQELSGRRATPAVELQIARAQQEALRIRSELDRLGALRATPQVNADIATAAAQLARVNQQLRDLDGRTARVNVDASTSRQASQILMGVVAALSAVGAAAPAAAAGLAAAGGAVGTLAQGAGAALAGFAGVGDALKALEADDKAAASTAASSAAQRSTAAKQIASAQRGLAQAQQQASRQAVTGAQQVAAAQQAVAQATSQAGRSAVQSAQQVASAERALAQTVVAAGRSRIQADQQVADARRAVTDAVVAATSRVQAAERSLESAQRSRQWAQEALTEAVKDAARANRDLQMSVAGAALSEERAVLSLAQARQRLAEARTSDPLERADLALSVREAEQNLREVQTRYGDLRQEQSEWARTGVAGSRQVVAAQRGVEDANRAVQDAQRGLTEAQVSGARSVADAQQALGRAQQQAAWQAADAQLAVADAQRNLAQAQQQAAWQAADAQLAVADAQRNLAETAQQAGWAQADAASAVSEAQIQLADASAGAGDSASASAAKAAAAMAKLTPAGRSLVGFLRDEWQPAWKRTTDSVAEEMLPKVEQAMRNLLTLEPLFRAGLTETGGILGDLAVKGSQLATSAPFQANFAQIMASNNRSLRSYGEAGLSLFGAFTDLYAAAGPVVEEFARLTMYSSDAFESWVVGARASGELDRYLRIAADTLKYLGGWLVDVGGNVLTVAGNLAPLGFALLEMIRYTTDFIARLSSVSPTLTSLAGGAALAAFSLSKLGSAVGTGGAIANLAANARAAGGALSTVFNPAAAASALQSTALAQRMAQGGDASKGFTGALTKVSGALPLVGAVLIGVSLAADAMNTSTSEAAAALMKGGDAARTASAEAAGMTAALDAQNAGWPAWTRALDEWVYTNILGKATTQSMTAEVERQRAAMTNLERAQSIATEMQGHYETALRESDPTSQRTRAAQRALSDATAAVAREQEAARRATMNATHALEDQQTKMLASINARLGYEQSVRSTKQAQDEYTAAVRGTGAGSDAAREALGRLQQSQVSQAEAATRAAVEEAKRRGETDTSRAATDGLARSVRDMVAASNGELSPALQSMVQSLDFAGLAAAGARVQVDDAGRAVAVFPDGKTVVLDANTSLVYPALASVKLAVDSTRGTVGVDADPGAGVATVGGFKLRVDQTTGVVGIDGNISPADQQRLGIQAKTDGTTGTMWIDGNPVPAAGRLNGMRVTVDRTTGVMTIDGEPRPANDVIDGAQRHASAPQTMPVGADTRGADGSVWDWWRRAWDWLKARPLQLVVDIIGAFTGSGGGPVPPPGRAMGGYVDGYAAGGAITHRQVIRGFPAGGRVRGPGTATSDSIPAMLSDGEYVIRASAVSALGVPLLNQLNKFAAGGPVHLAKGGRPSASAARRTPSQAGTAPQSLPPTAGADSGAAAEATLGLVDAMQSAVSTAGVLTPALAGLRASQQQLVNAGVLPLAGALNGPLQQALGAYELHLGTRVPAANLAMQAAHTATRVSMAQTAAVTSLNAAAMTSAVSASSAAQRGEHTLLRAAQTQTALSTDTLAANTLVNTGRMSLDNTNMRLATNEQLRQVRVSQGQSVLANDTMAGNVLATTMRMAADNTLMRATVNEQLRQVRVSQGQSVLANDMFALNTQIAAGRISGDTGQMRGTVNEHLRQVRLAQGQTVLATTTFADIWRDQMGRIRPDSGGPVKWVIDFPIASLTNAWNHLDGQFQLGKHVPPFRANFATGGIAPGGVMPGYTPGRDVMTANVSGGEAIMRPEWTRVVGSDYVHTANAAARQGGIGGVQRFLDSTTTRNPRAEGRAKQLLMRRFRLDDAPNPIRSDWAGAFAYGGVAPHVAMAGDEVTRVVGRMPGGIGGRGSRGNVSDHPAGFALDFMTLSNVALGNRVAAHLEANAERLAVKYLIWQRRINQGKGWRGMENRGSPTANHEDHVHASFEGGPLGGSWGDGPAGGGGFFDPTPIVEQAFAKAYQEIGDVTRFFGTSPQVLRDQGTARFAADKVKAHALTKLNEMFAASGGGGGNVERWRGVVNQALAMMGQPIAHAGSTLRRMNQESGGDPAIVNRWDSNWRRGTPSVGLMQVIGPTYRANADPRRNVGPYVYGTSIDPLSNVLASMRYALGRYGSLPAAYDRRGGYDNGGLLPPGRTLVDNNTGAPERVLNNVETRSYDTLTQLVGRNGVRLTLADTSAQPAIGTVNTVVPQGATVNDVARAITFQVRRAKRGGVYAGG